MRTLVTQQNDRLRGCPEIVDCAFGEHWFQVRYLNGAGYEFTTNSIGFEHMGRLKALAGDGEALARYIEQHCRTRFTRLLPASE